jgi:hypothetical protein
MRHWWWVWVVLAGVGLALPQGSLSFSTRSGYQAVATLFDQHLSVQVVGQPYALHIQFAGAAGPPNLSILASIVDMVVLWAESSRVAKGYKGCVIQVSADFFPDETLGGVRVKDCTGSSATLLYLVYLPQPDLGMT